jgi:hypothetical protein
MPVSTDTMAVVIAMPGAGAVLRRGAIGHVDVDVPLLEQLVLDAELRRARRTTVRAASIDSFITSPKLAGAHDLPLPGIRAASMVSRSPPTSVQARPVTWPTWLVFSARCRS